MLHVCFYGAPGWRSLWRPYDKTNGEITRVPRLTAAYHKVREDTKDWGDYKKLPEAIPNKKDVARSSLRGTNS